MVEATLQRLAEDYHVWAREDRGRKGLLGCWHRPPAGWGVEALDKVFRAVEDLAQVMGGPSAFRAQLQGVEIIPRVMTHGGLGKAHRVILLADRFDHWTVVHELAHAWDGVNGWRLSKALQRAMGARFERPLLHFLFRAKPDYWYDPGSGPPPCGVDANFNRKEDFAEAVTAYVYPDRAWQRAHPTRPRDNWQAWPYEDPTRGYTYPGYRETPRGQYIGALLRSPLA